MSTNLNNLVSLTGIHNCLNQEDWITSLEQYEDQVTDREQIGGQLFLLQDSLIDKIKTKLVPISLTGSLVDLRLVNICRVFKIFERSNQTKLFESVFETYKLHEHVSAVFDARKKETLSDFMGNLGKLVGYVLKSKSSIFAKVTLCDYSKILKNESKLPWNLRVIDVNNKVEVFLRGPDLGVGTRQKVVSLISCSSPLILAETHPVDKKNPDRMDLYKTGLKLDYKISKKLRKSDVPNILNFMFVEYHSVGRNIMPCCSQGTLLDYLFYHETTLVERIELFLEIAKSVEGMHKKRSLCHLDLKITNILVTIVQGKPVIRLTDFEKTMREELGNNEASLHYISCTFPAPEWVEGVFKFEKAYAELKSQPDFALLESKKVRELMGPYFVPVSHKFDSWCLAEILYKLAYQKPLFYETFNLDASYVKDVSKLFKETVEECLAFIKKKLGNSSNLLDQCIVQLLDLDPEKRMGTSELVDKINLWLKTQNKDNMSI